MGIALDKQAHVWMGAAVAAGLVAYGLPPVLAFAVGIAVGALKEVVDPLIGGHRDAGDFVATALGSAVVLPLNLITALPLAFLAQWWPF